MNLCQLLIAFECYAVVLRNPRHAPPHDGTRTAAWRASRSHGHLGMWQPRLMVSTHLKSMPVKLDHSPNFPGENKTYLKPPPGWVYYKPTWLLNKRSTINISPPQFNFGNKQRRQPATTVYNGAQPGFPKPSIQPTTFRSSWNAFRKPSPAWDGLVGKVSTRGKLRFGTGSWYYPRVIVDILNRYWY